MEGLEKKVNLLLILGLWFVILLLSPLLSQWCCCCCCCFFSVWALDSLSLGMDVQKALLHPATIFSHIIESQSVRNSMVVVEVDDDDGMEVNRN